MSTRTRRVRRRVRAADPQPRSMAATASFVTPARMARAAVGEPLEVGSPVRANRAHRQLEQPVVDLGLESERLTERNGPAFLFQAHGAAH